MVASTGSNEKVSFKAIIIVLSLVFLTLATIFTIAYLHREDLDLDTCCFVEIVDTYITTCNVSSNKTIAVLFIYLKNMGDENATIINVVLDENITFKVNKVISPHQVYKAYFKIPSNISLNTSKPHLVTIEYRVGEKPVIGRIATTTYTRSSPNACIEALGSTKKE